jgi:hypothetical protein
MRAVTTTLILLSICVLPAFAASQDAIRTCEETTTWLFEKHYFPNDTSSQCANTLYTTEQWRCVKDEVTQGTPVNTALAACGLNK